MTWPAAIRSSDWFCRPVNDLQMPKKKMKKDAKPVDNIQLLGIVKP